MTALENVKDICNRGRLGRKLGSFILFLVTGRKGVTWRSAKTSVEELLTQPSKLAAEGAEDMRRVKILIDENTHQVDEKRWLRLLMQNVPKL